MNRNLNPQMIIRDRLLTLITFVLGSLVVNQIQTQPGLQPREIIMTHLRSGSMERVVTNLLRLTLWATKETWLVLLHSLNHLSDCQTKAFAPPFMQKSNWHATALIRLAQVVFAGQTHTQDLQIGIIRAILQGFPLRPQHLNQKNI